MTLEEALARIAELEAACSKTEDAVSQTLGKVLRFPWFKDDQQNFPGATEEDGVCVGEYTAEDLAQLVAKRIVELEAALRPFAEVWWVHSMSDGMALQPVNGFTDRPNVGDCRRAAAVLKGGAT